MASPTRAEIQRRIAADDGAGGDTVYIPTGNRTTSSVHCYHAHQRCYTMRADTECTDDTRGHAQELGLAPCKVCVLDDVAEPDTETVAALEAMDPGDLGLGTDPRPDGDADADRDDADGADQP